MLTNVAFFLEVNFLCLRVVFICETESHAHWKDCLYIHNTYTRLLDHHICLTWIIIFFHPNLHRVVFEVFYSILIVVQTNCCAKGQFSTSLYVCYHTCL